MLVIHRLTPKVTVKMISPQFKKEAKCDDREQQNARNHTQRKELWRLRDSGVMMVMSEVGMS